MKKPTKDVQEQKLTLLSQNRLGKLRDKGDAYSSGVYLHERGKEYVAWINYRSGLGGNWYGYGETPDKAVADLFKAVEKWQREHGEKHKTCATKCSCGHTARYHYVSDVDVSRGQVFCHKDNCHGWQQCNLPAGFIPENQNAAH